jgi:hypothetical protein
MDPPDRRWAEMAAHRHNVVSRRDVTMAGLSSSALYRRVANGLLVPAGTHSYRFAGVQLDWFGQLQAGLFDLGEDALVAGRAAAALFGLDGFAEGSVSFYLPRSQRRRLTTGAVRSGPPVHRFEIVRVRDFPCTSAALRIAHLAAEVSERELANALDSAVRLRLTSVDLLTRRLTVQREKGIPGMQFRDRVLTEAGVESWLERRFLRLVKETSLPLPLLQRVYRQGGRHVARVDFDFAPLPFVAELAGQRGYLTRRERQRQERRRNALQLAGKAAYFFTYEDVVEEPVVVLDTLRSAVRGARGRASLVLDREAG